MRNKESREVLRLAIDITVFAVICIFLVNLTGVSRNIYNVKSERDALKEMISTESEKYFFEYSEHIFGTDLIAYIVRYDATYDYYISLNDGRKYEITKDYAKELRSSGKDGNIIWSQDYLTNTVFIDKVFSEFNVLMSTKSDGSIDYFISQK